ncbi:type I polyketide synthase [Aureispira anguillae]|uniref:Phosphopantetheine-binding protein n=1 Tax=Aureispira anguillae TaxID=2864201 RepID=A0A915YDK2_9BACT|nr:type I polyketide synthase [Aureispira anguillae]BDS11135.1 phosphopantetheine-binding protein [Aureispira anguillae]
MNLNNSLRKTPVAVIGMSSLFADAKNIEEFWNNIVQARDSITDVPENRWRIEDYYDPDPTVPDKTYCKRGGFLPNIDFNPMEFGLPPNILEVTDASQLLALIAARDAFAHAGYGKKSEKFTAEVKAKTGVLLGVGGGQKLITPLTGRLQYPIWEKALRSCGIAETDIPHIVDKMKKAYIGWNENSFPGMLGNVISGRITNRFDLGGINSVVDAACAASLSAVKMALSELVEGRADMMLTGGVDTDNSPFMYMSFSKTPAFSKSNVISPFSDKADGMLIGEGLGMVVLKRLEDAERDGDTIYAVIKGVGTSSDGRFKSVYAPRPSGQASAMNRAYEEAGFEAKTVGLIEAHGTGTNAGDACELTSMGMVFSANNDQKSHIALGTVKSQVGHTKAAAGAAGLLKAVLALHHKVLPPTINVDQPTEKVDLKDSPLYINTEARPWFNNNEPRRASVSAFGFGGINVHIALEEYQAQPVEKDYRIHEPYKAVVLQANTVADLAQLCQNKLEQLNTADQEIAFWELVNHQTQNIPANAARLGFMTTDIASAKEVLTLAIQKLSTSNNAWEHPKGIYFRPNGMDAQGKVVALFSGQGSQYVGMGRQLVNAFPQLRTVIDQQDRLFTQANRPALSETMYPIPVFNKEDAATQLQALTQTQNAQPAIGALSMGMYKTIQDAGFKADFVAGHSFGELTALWAAGVYDDATFLALAKARGEAMAAQSPNADAGTMLAVKADYNKVNAAIQNLQGVKIANVNSNNQVILGGSKPAIATAQETLKNQGFAVIPLPVSAAFHTEFVGHAQKPFADFVARQNFQAPKVPVYSNTTSNPYPTAPASIKEILQGQILKPVLFKNQIENIHQAGGRIFIEFGPKGVLSNLVKDILKGKDFIALAMNGNAKKDSDLQFRQAVLQLRVLGLALHELDPFKAPSTKPAPKTKMTINMGGHNYVSKPTQKAYYDALNDGYQVKGGGQVVEKVVEVIKEVPVEKIVEKIIEVPVEKVVHSNNINIEEDEEMNKELIETLKATVEMVTSQQNKSLELFQNFLSEQNKQSQLLLQMMTQQLNLANQPALQATVQASLQEAKVEKIAAPSFQPAVASNEPIITPAPTATPVTPAAPTANTGGLSTQKLEEILLTVISEKTGYPTEMLELDMDMEADLGIDSIKRVEIFGAMTEDYPEVSGVNPQELTELRTLGQIVDYLAGKAGASATATTATTTPAPTTTPVTPAAPTANTGGLSTQKLEEILLTVISEKTGYPTEMLELDMDMEADLGIDSIKRVEIFGAMTEDYPEVSGVNPQELTELRTLGQIVDYLAGKAGASATATTATTTPAPTATPVTPAAPTANTGGLSTQKLEEILLTVISEKTGYPTEMLELDMDMEADLGIDSIKRVEIFGAMTEDYPEVSGVNPQELTELRTLGQIVDYLAGKAGASATTTTATTTPAPTATPVTPAAPTANTGGLSTQKLEEILLTVISEKTGYPTEMLELDMDMEADLGIDSIKRVEIFGAMTEDYPEVSGVNPQELTELRTLGQIVDYLAGKAGASATATTATTTPVTPAAPTANAGGLSTQKLEEILLTVISEKTGYPTEMLELDMDMEADLGIDSIKRVEIFGAMTEDYPEVSGVNPQELTELRTLGQIVDYLAEKAGSKKKVLA